MAYVFIFPKHTELTIQDYPLEKTQFPPMLSIYPVERFRELLPDYFPARLSDLQQLLSGATISSASPRQRIRGCGTMGARSMIA